MGAPSTGDHGVLRESVLIDGDGLVQGRGQQVPGGLGQLIEGPKVLPVGGELEFALLVSVHDGFNGREVPLALVVVHQLHHGMLALVDDAHVKVRTGHGLLREQADVVASEDDGQVWELVFNLPSKLLGALKNHGHGADSNQIRLVVANPLHGHRDVEFLGCCVEHLDLFPFPLDHGREVQQTQGGRVVEQVGGHGIDVTVSEDTVQWGINE